MPRSATEHPEKSRGTNLLQEFEDSLPDFQSLDEEQHLKFAKTIRLLCGYFDISEARLRREHFFKLKSTIARHCSLGGTSLLKDVFVRVARGLVRLAESAKKSHAVGRAITDYASFSASTSFVIAARSGSDAI